jgi:putative endonuclease
MRDVIAVYILASGKQGTLYVGVTSNLVKRIWEHKNTTINDSGRETFTSRYAVHSLVWFETHETMESAIHREKRIKKYTRAKKITLIEASNPQWLDLFRGICH